MTGISDNSNRSFVYKEIQYKTNELIENQADSRVLLYDTVDFFRELL